MHRFDREQAGWNDVQIASHQKPTALSLSGGSNVDPAIAGAGSTRMHGTFLPLKWVDPFRSRMRVPSQASMSGVPAISSMALHFVTFRTRAFESRSRTTGFSSASSPAPTFSEVTATIVVSIGPASRSDVCKYLLGKLFFQWAMAMSVSVT